MYEQVVRADGYCASPFRILKTVTVKSHHRTFERLEERAMPCGDLWGFCILREVVHTLLE
jgi:hypothetical protein